MRLNDEIINKVRDEASITEVIGHYIPLVKKGKGYTAICPFHDDHDPSLSISEDKKIYKCFVCGNGGNVFTFVQNFKKISFPESVVEVSKVIGKPIDIELDNKPKAVSKYQRDYDLLETMISYSNYLLTGTAVGKDAKDYLINRGLDEEVINTFGIGFNPKENSIYKYLKSKGFKDEEMIKTNVARMLDNGMADIFYNRVLFPIHDAEGHPVAFTARTLGNDTSKYINTGETEIYTKGNILYNYHRVKENIKKSGQLIVVEGVMDVIAYYRAGIYNVVATLGTACSKRQLELLQSLTNNLVLGYDGDNPGIAANIKLGQMAINAGMNVQVIDNDTMLDPDEIIAKYDKNALRDLSGKKLSFIDYAIKQFKKRANLDNYSDRKEYHSKISSLIELLKDDDDKENYYNALYEITKIRKRGNSVKKEYNDRVILDHDYGLDGLTKAEYIILTQMIMSYKATSIYQKELGCLLDDNNQQLALLIVDEYRKYKECQLARLYDQVDDEKIKQLIASLATIEILPEEFDESVLRGAIEKERLELKKHKLEQLKEMIQATKNVSTSETNKYLEEYMTLLKELGSNYVSKEK